MGRKYKNYGEAAAEYADLKRLAQTADSMGARKSAKAYRDEASEVRQGFFGPDAQFKR